MFNETPNNNDIMCIANTVLKEAPNSNDATQRSKKYALNYHEYTTILNDGYIAIM